MMLSFCRYFLMFFVLSVAGWCMEVVLKLIELRRFINRGFLIGPYCPIYGVGAVLISLLLSDFSAYPLVILFLSLLLCGSLEYATSYFMEKLFHARWWDYSQKRFNLNGRICANTLIPFALMSLLMIYVIQPWLFSLFDRIPDGVLCITACALMALMLGDAVLSVNVLGKIRSIANCTGADDTETLTRCIRTHLHEQSALIRRTLHAFPQARLYNGKLIAQLREKQAKLREEASRLRAEMEAYENRLRRKH